MNRHFSENGRGAADMEVYDERSWLTETATIRWREPAGPSIDGSKHKMLEDMVEKCKPTGLARITLCGC